MDEWMSKQMTGDINSFIFVAKSPVMEDQRQQGNNKDVKRLDSCHTCHRARERRNQPKISEGKILDHRLCHLSLSTYCILCSFSCLSLFLSYAHRRKTQTFLSPPPGERVNGPLILRSEDQSQQGSHVCQIKKTGVALLTLELQCMQELLDGWKNKRENE